MACIIFGMYCRRGWTWWRHKMETISALLAFGEGNHRSPASDAELWCFLWSAPEQSVKQTIETLVIWNAIATVLTCKNWSRKELHEELCPPGRIIFGKVCPDMASTFWFLPYLSYRTTGETPDQALPITHDDVIKWKPFPRYWPFVRGIHWSPVNSPHKGQWRGALIFLWSASE